MKRMKSLSLRARYTLVSSLFLLCSCTLLTALSNHSANQLAQSISLTPAMPSQPVSHQPAAATNAPVVEATISAAATQASYRLFRQETMLATAIIVGLGSTATYFAAGYVLRPIQVLSREIQQRSPDNFDAMLPVPSSADEVRTLTLSFNALLAELHHAFCLQQQFSADAAHELRTPLAALQAKLDVFSMSHHLTDDTRSFITSMQAQLQRLSTLVEDLLLFSRDLPLSFTEEIALMPLLEELIDALAPQAQTKQLHITLSGDSCTIHGQDRLIERVFFNLLENAIKYSPVHGCIAVQITQKHQAVCVQVADHAACIAPEHRTAVFEPFFRIDASRSREAGGSGLGLAICKKILARHHAQIDVSANHPTGNIFCVTFSS